LERRVAGRRYVPLPVARRLVESRLAEEGYGVDPSIPRVRDYLKLFGDRDPDKAEEAVEKLKALGLQEVTAVDIVNICPGTPGEVRSILVLEPEKNYDEELVKRILDEISEYCASMYPE